MAGWVALDAGCADGFPDEGAIRALAPGYDGRVLYAEEGGTGDGAVGAPFGSVAQALEASAPGDVVVVAGSHPEVLTLEGVALVGVCVDEAQLTGGVTLRDGALLRRVTVDGLTVPLGATAAAQELVVAGDAGVAVRGSVEVTDLVVADAVGDGQGGAGLTVDGGRLSGVGVTVLRSTNIGLHVRGGSASLSGLIIADTRPVAVAPYRGRGLQAEGGGSVEVSGLVLSRNRNSALLAAGPAVVQVTDAWIADTRGDEGTDTFGDGLTPFDAAEIALRRVYFQRNRNSGITAVTAGVELDIEQVVIDDTQIGAVNNYGNGVYVEAGAQVTARQLLVTGSRGSGIALHDAGTHFEATDLVVAAGLPNAAGSFGRGIGIQSAAADVERALVADNTEAGVYLSGGAALTARDLRISGTRPDPGTAEFGFGVNANSASTMAVTRGHFTDNATAGLLVGDADTVVRLSDCEVSQTVSNEMGEATGITVQQGALAEVDRVVLVRNQGVAVAVIGGGARLEGSDLLIEETLPREADGKGGRAVEISLGGRLTVERATVSHNRELAFFVKDSGSAAEVVDLVVVDTQPGSIGAGRAVNIQGGGRFVGVRVRSEGASDAAIFVAGTGSVVELTDAVISGTEESPAGTGRGASVQEAGSLTLVRAVFARATEGGMFANGVGTQLTLEDVFVGDTRADAEGRFGRGITLQNGVTARMDRVQVSRNLDVGVFVHGQAAALFASDLEVRDTGAQPIDGDFGRGIVVQAGATFTGSRLRVTDNRQVGLFVLAGGEADVDELDVRGTVAVPCEADCASIGGGSGIIVLAGALTIQRFVVRESELAGLRIGDDSQLMAVDGLISENRIGLNVQDDTLDLAASFERVRVRGNETDRDLANYPAPSAVDTLDALTDAE